MTSLRQYLEALKMRLAQTEDIDEAFAIEQESSRAELDHMLLTDLARAKVERLSQPKELPEVWKPFWKPRVVAGGRK